MRKIVAALQISLDGFIEGPNGEIDWIDTWEDRFQLTPQIGAFVMGGGMYAGYEFYWRSILADPSGILPFSGKTATAGEVEYAMFADKTPHYVLSNTLQEVSWEITRVVHSMEEIRDLKQQSGDDIHALGGAGFVGSLLNEGLVDEIRLLVHPVILGGGKALFKDVELRQSLRLVKSDARDSGHLLLTYAVQKG
jgi:dihydrofolate reductase